MSIYESLKAVVRFVLRMDIPLLILVTCLFSFSIYAIHFIGGEAGGPFEAYAKKQFLWVCVGFGLMLAIAYVDYEWIGVNSWVFYVFGLLLLTAVLIPGIGKEINGARSWISMPGFTIQPSEIAKPCTLVALAWYASRPRVLLNEFTKLIPVVLMAGGPVVLIGLQPDFGSALVFIPLTAVVLFVAGCKRRYLTYPILMAVILTPIMYFALQPHQKKRIDVFIHPVVQPLSVKYSQKKALEAGLAEEKYERIEKMSNPWFYTKTEIAHLQGVLSTEKDRQAFEKGEINKEEFAALCEKEYKKRRRSYRTINTFNVNEGWQGHQSLLAVASGGWSGKGFGNGTQIKLGFLPKSISTTDCLFSVICEEGGFVWAVIVLMLLLGVILCSVRTACVARDLYGKVLSLSIGMLFLCHVYINVGMAIGIAPIIGIPLPFLSYGGSFVISTMVCVGLLQNIYIRREVTASEERLAGM